MNDGLLPSDEGTDLKKVLANTFPRIAYTEFNLNRVIHDILGCRELSQ